MNVLSCENIYISCSSNCYPHCMDTRDNWIVFGTANSLAIYDLNLRRVISTLSHHSDLINSVRWIDKKTDYIISSSKDGTSIIWQKNNDFQVKHVLNGGHTNSVIISDSKPVRNLNNSYNFYSASSSNDKSLCLWLNDQIIFSTNLDHFIFDLKIFYNELIISGLILFTAGSNGSVLISRFDLDNKNFESLINIKGHCDWIKSIDLIPINDKLMLASASQDFSIRVYEIRQCFSSTEVKFLNEVFTLKHSDKEESFSFILETVLSSHEGPVSDVKWIYFENQLHLLTCSMDKTIILWEQMDHQHNFIWNEKYHFGEVGSNAIGFLCCSFIPSFNLIVGQSYEGAIHMWKKIEQKDFWTSCPPVTGHFKEVTDLVWEPEGEYFLTCSSDQTTRLHSQWNSSFENVSSWHEIARPQIHGYDIKSLAMAGRLEFVSGADEKVIRVFNATENFVKSLQNISSLKIDIKGNKIAKCAIVPSLGLSNSAVYDELEIKKFNVKTINFPPSEEILLQNTLWSESQKLYGHGYEVFAVAVNHASTLLASTCKASSANHAAIILWDLKTFKKLADLYSHNLTITQIRFSPNDLYLLSVSRDRTWALFEMKSSQYQRLAFSDKNSGIHSRIIWDCAWTPDSKYFLTGSRDKSVITWFLNDSQDNSEVDCDSMKVQSKETLSFNDPVTSLDVHEKFMDHNCYLVCFGLENGSFLLYSLSIESKWLKMYDFKSFWHAFSVNRIRFSSKIDKRNSHRIVHMASCSQDRSIKLFKITF